MKTKKEIEARIKETNDDDRMKADPAEVFSNAPLALIQTNYEGQLQALEWVLKEK